MSACKRVQIPRFFILLVEWNWHDMSNKIKKSYGLLETDEPLSHKISDARELSLN